jgi:hypothetical protein
MAPARPASGSEPRAPVVAVLVSREFVFTGGGLPNPGKDLERNGYSVYLGHVDDRGQTIANMVVPPNPLPGPRFIAIDAAFTTLTLIAMADALFAPLGRNLRDVDLMLAQHLAREFDVRLLTVLI